MTYTVYKYHQDDRRPKAIHTGLTLAEAREICNDPETSSHTATPPLGCGGNESKIDEWSETNSHWFYGYESEG